jgi:hypothetical protein
MNIIEADGKWHVVEGERVLHVAATNAGAWRWLDRCEGSPISRGEDVAEWIWSKIVNGEGR